MSQFYIGLNSGNIPPQIPTSFLLDDGNSAVASGGVVAVTGGSGTHTTLGASNQIEVNVVNDGFPWTEEATSFAAAIQNGYFCNAALTATLPASPGLTIGNTIIFFIDTASVVTIQAGAGEMIQIGSVISAPGGIATSNARGATVELVFKPSDLTWHSISSLGIWSVT
jgi:hypothetical protein